MSSSDIDYLLEAGDLLSKSKSLNDAIEIIVEYANSFIQPDLSCFYLNKKANKQLKLFIKKGFLNVPDYLDKNSELILFLTDSQELVCLNNRKESPFNDLLLSESMKSGLAIIIYLGNIEYGILIVNSVQPLFFRNKEIVFIENLARITRKTEPIWSNK
jgi:hypothetical protein